MKQLVYGGILMITGMLGYYEHVRPAMKDKDNQ